MYLYFMSTDSCLRSKEVTESILFVFMRFLFFASFCRVIRCLKLSSPWCIWSAWVWIVEDSHRSQYIAKRRGRSLKVRATPECKRTSRNCFCSCHRIQVTEWLRRHWVLHSTVLPILRTPLHFDRRACYHKCALLPPSHELSLRTPCTCRVVSTTCCTSSGCSCSDVQWSCVCFHLSEWEIAAGIGCHRYWGLPLTVQGWKVLGVCIPRMSIEGTSQYGIRSIHCRHNHFLPSLVPLRHFCTISGNHSTNHRYDPCEWYEGVPIDNRWDWESWVSHPVSTWDCMPW